MPSATSRPVVGVHAFLIGLAAVALFALTSRYPGYVHHDTAEIVMWSTLDWPVGLPKHPPLMPWLFRAVSYVVPLDWVTLSLLTAVNIVLGAWAVHRLALVYLDEARAALALILYAVMPSVTFFALKLNHNAILVSLWPLTVWAFVGCLRAETVRESAWRGVLFGLAAAAAMLAKYYSGVLLACCFLASLASPQRGRFYSQPGGYVAVAVFALVMLPHGLWVVHQGGETLTYALHETERDEYPALRFLIGTPLYLVLPIALYVLLGGRQSWPSAVGASGERRVPPELIVLSVAPFALTAMLIAAMKLRGATSWALPDFCVAPVVLAAMLPAPASLERIKRAGKAVLAGVAAGGPVVLTIAFLTGDSNAVEPRMEAAGVARAVFLAVTGREPALVGGEPQLINTAAMVLPSHPMGITYFDRTNAPWATRPAMNRDGLLAFCRASSKSPCRPGAEALAGRPAVFSCEFELRRHWLWMTGRALRTAVAVIAPVDAPAFDKVRAQAACQPEGIPGQIEPAGH